MRIFRMILLTRITLSLNLLLILANSQLKVRTLWPYVLHSTFVVYHLFTAEYSLFSTTFLQEKGSNSDVYILWMLYFTNLNGNYFNFQLIFQISYLWIEKTTNHVIDIQLMSKMRLDFYFSPLEKKRKRNSILKDRDGKISASK